MKKRTSLIGKIIIAVFVLVFAALFTACKSEDVRDYFIVTFDKNGGDTEAVPRTINVNEKNTPKWRVGTLPKEPTREGYIFDGWYTTKVLEDGEEFLADTLITSDMTVYAQWVEGSFSVKKDSQRAKAFASLKGALDSISGAGNYLVKIGENQALSPYTFSGDKVKVTLESSSGNKEIAISRSVASDFSLFTVEDSATLTLSSGITLNGGFAAGCGVNVGSNGTFIMQNGIISGFVGTGSTGVNVTSSTGTFTMKGGTISGNKGGISGYGGGVSNRGTFTLEDGTISGNEASYGGGVSNRGTGGIFTMKGGNIHGGNKATTNGGGVYNEDGKFTLITGNISLNVASGNGGGVYNWGTFDMEGGNITINQAVNGGGVYNTGTFTLKSNGTISKNYASGDGGGVYNSETFSMEGGNINGENTADNGGGVYVFSGVFSMNNGTISGNTAENGDGGGVNVYVAASFNMYGGAISGNTADNGYGGGVYVTSGGSFFKEPAADSSSGSGTIFGKNEGSNSNVASDDEMGHAAYQDNSDPDLIKIRDTTAGPAVPLTSWDESWE